MPNTALKNQHEKEHNLYLQKIAEIMQQKETKADTHMSNVYSLAKILQAYEQSMLNAPVSFQREM